MPPDRWTYVCSLYRVRALAGLRQGLDEDGHRPRQAPCDPVELGQLPTESLRAALEIDDDEQSVWLRQERGITCEDIVFHVAHGGLLDMEECVCLVPFVEDDEVILLKTIMPSRNMTKLYLGGDAA